MLQQNERGLQADPRSNKNLELNGTNYLVSMNLGTITFAARNSEIYFAGIETFGAGAPRNNPSVLKSSSNSGQ